MAASSMMLMFLSFVFYLACVVAFDNFDFDSLPGVSYDFKLHVDAGKEDCFYQYVQPGAKLFASYQVLRGGDGMAGFAVRHPNGAHVHPYQWKAESEYQETSDNGGIYEICVDNQFSRFASKLVSMFIVAYKQEEWAAFTKELEELDLSVSNFTSSLTLVDERVTDMLKYQRTGRLHEVKDFLTLESNLGYVHWWSMAQCIIIVVTSTIQVYFVKKLFEVPNVTPTSKPRA